jgi:hypothetical protein
MIVFFVFIVFPIGVPESISKMVDSSLGMLSIFIVTVFLFLYTHPVLAILYVFVAYELIRRSSRVTGKTAYIQYTPTQEKRDAYMKAMNPPKIFTLEEEMVSQMAPIIVPDTTPSQHVETSFRPVADSIGNASMI